MTNITLGLTISWIFIEKVLFAIRTKFPLSGGLFNQIKVEFDILKHFLIPRFEHKFLQYIVQISLLAS